MFGKKKGPTRAFSHAPDCKILKADPGAEIRGRRSRPAFGSPNACAGKSMSASRSPMVVCGSTRWTRPPSATSRHAISGT